MIYNIMIYCVMQTSGEAVYVADVGISTRELFAAPVESTRALAKLDKVDPSAALKLSGVVAFVGEPFPAVLGSDITWENCKFTACLHADALLAAILNLL